MVNDPNANALVVIDAGLEFRQITVFNETDKVVKLQYKDSGSNPSNFQVPAGKAFTRIMHQPIAHNSLYIASVGGAATGDVIINLGN